MAYVYDELGRLLAKKYGNNIVSETYSYNVRGWLTEKNSSKFNMKLRYQNPSISGTTARYNGNISEWEWKQGTNTAQTYSFTYDGISRLKESNQYAQNGSSWTLNNAFTEQGLTYDENGNIKTLQRKSNGTLSDNFSYTYNGNQLTQLSSASGSYLYDNNGNMTKDPRKNLELSYNSLNLLSEVRQSSGIKAKYVYAADGTKLAVADVGGNGYDYRGSLIYKNTSGTKSLESVAFSDGRITKTNSTYVPNYYLTDHLGSVRVIFDASGTVLEQNDYYAFGEKHQNSNLLASNNRFKYNGKELQTTGDLGLLDYGARMYDNKLGRWSVLDPKAEKYYGLSGYNYCVNNPIVYIDPNGEDAWTTSNRNQISDFLSSLKNGNERKDVWDWDYASDREFLFGHSLFGNSQSVNYLTSMIANLRKYGLSQLDWRSVMNNGSAIATQVLKGILYQNLDGVKNRGIVDMNNLFAGYPGYYDSRYTDKIANFNNLTIKGFGTPFTIKHFEIAPTQISQFNTNPTVKDIDNFNPKIIDRGYTFRVVGDGSHSIPLVYLRVNVNDGSENLLKNIIFN